MPFLVAFEERLEEWEATDKTELAELSQSSGDWLGRDFSDLLEAREISRILSTLFFVELFLRGFGGDSRVVSEDTVKVSRSKIWEMR